LVSEQNLPMTTGDTHTLVTPLRTQAEHGVGQWEVVELEI